MNRFSRALWERRLTYRVKRVSHWRAKGNIPQVNKWVALVREAKAKLAPAKKLPLLKGIDISSYNGSVDFKKLQAAGYGFVIAKSSEGADWKDGTFTKERVKEIRAAGMRVGAYHFLRPKPGRSGKVEGAFFINTAYAAGYGKPGDLRPVIDFEATQLGRPQTLRYLVECINEVKRLTGKAPIIYTGGPFWNENTGECRDNFGCQLWLAAYVKDPQQYLPAAWATTGWAIWQHTDTGSVPGVRSASVDQNIAKRLPLL
jgi:lysozyme